MRRRMFGRNRTQGSREIRGLKRTTEHAEHTEYTNTGGRGYTRADENRIIPAEDRRLHKNDDAENQPVRRIAAAADRAD